MCFVNGCGLGTWKLLSQELGMFINCIVLVRLMRLVSIIPTCYIKQAKHV